MSFCHGHITLENRMFWRLWAVLGRLGVSSNRDHLLLDIFGGRHLSISPFDYRVLTMQKVGTRDLTKICRLKTTSLIVGVSVKARGRFSPSVSRIFSCCKSVNCVYGTDRFQTKYIPQILIIPCSYDFPFRYHLKRFSFSDCTV